MKKPLFTGLAIALPVSILYAQNAFWTSLTSHEDEISVEGQRSFDASTTLNIISKNPKSKLYYRILPLVENGEKVKFKPYKKPFSISESQKIEVFDKTHSKEVKTFTFYKKPNNWIIDNATPSVNNTDARSLIDGILGSGESTMRDWVVYNEEVVEIIIDRRVTDELNSVDISFLNLPHSNFRLPNKIELFMSGYPKMFIKMGTLELPEEELPVTDKLRHTFRLDVLPTTARYIKLKIYQPHPSSYLAIDEIM